MLDSIVIAQSGLNGHQKGLKTISNNVSNMNTVGFKASVANFADACSSDQAGGNAYGPGQGFGGAGLDVRTATLNLRAGELHQTGNDLDAAVNGDGYFVFRDEEGSLFYSKDGQFEFDGKSQLIGRTSGLKVLALDAGGKLKPVDLSGFKTNPPKATTTVVLDGNLSSTATSHSIDTLKVYDALGGEHTLKLTFATDVNKAPGVWTVSVLEGTNELVKGEFRFTGGLKDPATTALKFQVSSNGGGTTPIELSLADSATSFSTGTTSGLALKNQDGYGLGTITKTVLNDKGQIELTYSNGQTSKTEALALARFASGGQFIDAGQSMFVYQGADSPELRTAGNDLKIATQTLEYSNVDLTDQFSNLILMQRGYQASSQVLSTANDMIQELFDMKGRR